MAGAFDHLASCGTAESHTASSPTARSEAAWEELRRLVVGDPALCRQLCALTDLPGFSRAVASLAEEHGLALNADDVVAALAAARQGRNERWV